MGPRLHLLSNCTKAISIFNLRTFCGGQRSLCQIRSHTFVRKTSSRNLFPFSCEIGQLTSNASIQPTGYLPPSPPPPSVTHEEAR
jgi:hypothetical protein